MEKRIQIDVAEPQAFKAIFSLENYLGQTKLSKTHLNLIKIRASIINGCTYCIDMHVKEAISDNEDHQRVYLLASWQKTDVYTEEERMMLQMTDEITMIHKEGLTTETYNAAAKMFDEHYFSQIVMAIATINVWNRVAISTHKPLG